MYFNIFIASVISYRKVFRLKLIITQSNLTLMGGAERVLLKIAQHYNAPIYTGEYNKNTTFPEFEELDVNVIKMNPIYRMLPYGRAVQGLHYGLGFYGLKITEDYDVINAHIAPSHWIRRNNERVLWYCHTPLREVWDLYDYRMKLKKFYQKPIHIAGASAIRKIDKSIVKNIEYIFANSTTIRRRLVQYFGRTDAKVLGGGIDYKQFSNQGDDHYFYYPARFSPNKGQHLAVEAFAKFKKLNKGKRSYKLVLAGAVSKDKFLSDYFEKVGRQAQKVGDIMIIPNANDEQWIDLYSRCTAIVHPAENEDYGIAPLEGMASGKAVIAFNEGGPTETIVDNETGYLVDGTTEMAKKMLFVAEHPSIANKVGKAGMKRVKEHYSWERFFERYDHALKEVADRKRG